MNLNGKDCVSHVPQCSVRMNKCVDDSCKQRAKCLRCSLVIAHKQCCQWQASLIQGKSLCLAEVSVTEQILWKFPNSKKSRYN